MKHIGLITAFFPPHIGGVEAYLHAFVHWYPGTLTLITPAPVTQKLPENVHAVARRFFSPRPVFPAWLPFAAQLRTLIRTEKIEEIVLGHFAPYAPGIALLARITGIPWSTFLHGVDFLQWERSGLRRAIRNRTLRTATHVIANGTFLADAAARAGVSRHSLHIAHPGVDQDAYYHDRSKRFLQQHGLLGKRIILSAGRLIPRKGFDTTVRAFASTHTAFPETVLVIMGEGPERKALETLTQELRLRKAVHFIGAVTDVAEKRQWYSAADCFVMPTRTLHHWDTESFGMVYVEALACGTPVIASDIGGARDIVVHGRNGFRVGDGTAVAPVADAMQKIIGSRETSEMLAGYARASVIPRFTWQQQFSSLERLWNV